MLDTWFSSRAVAVLHAGLARRHRRPAHFYPTSVLETGYDILFFWVARMIMLGLECTGEMPFDTVYLHGLIRDEQGREDEQDQGQRDQPAGRSWSSTAPTPCASRWPPAARPATT